jgi:2,3-bisphosphoglycerate-independent phosphoglycerate mutase
VTADGKNVGVREGGSLRDISPTVLGLMEMELPKEMTGGDLRVKR